MLAVDEKIALRRDDCRWHDENRGLPFASPRVADRRECRRSGRVAPISWQSGYVEHFDAQIVWPRSLAADQSDGAQAQDVRVNEKLERGERQRARTIGHCHALAVPAAPVTESPFP